MPDEYHDDETLDKAFKAMTGEGGLGTSTARSAINAMLNAGILFRERMSRMSDPRVDMHDGQSRRPGNLIIPILGTEDPNGVKYTMEQTVGIAVGAASMLFNTKDGVFDDQRARQIVNELMANIDQFASERVAEHVTNQDEKRAALLQREDWQESVDAMVWAAKFVEIINHPNFDSDIDEGLMVGWFANAMVAATAPLERAIQDDQDERRFYAGRRIAD